MKNDSARNDRNSVLRKPQENVETLQGVKETPADVDCCNGSRLDVDAIEEEAEARAIGVIARSWSGNLPAPEDFNKYDARAQQKIFEWNDALILDESRRQDEIIKKSSRESARKSYLSFFTNIIPIAISGIAFIVTKDPNSFWLLSVPCVTIGVNIFINTKNNNDEDDK